MYVVTIYVPSVHVTCLISKSIQINGLIKKYTIFSWYFNPRILFSNFMQFGLPIILSTQHLL